MFTRWTQHLKDTEEKQKFVNEVYSSRHVLEHLDSMLDNLGKGLERAERSPRAYDQPNWDYRQSHVNGYMQCLSDVRTMIDLDQQKDTSK